ncbi:MAG: glycoside hydrolase domain-containing protein [Terriglobia bacterium]
MTRSTLLFLTAVFVFALTPLRAVDAAGPHVWFVDSLIKIFPGDAVGTHRLVATKTLTGHVQHVDVQLGVRSSLSLPELLAARGQHVSLQLAVRSPRAIEGVTAEVGPFKDSAGATLDGVTVRPEGYVVVGSHSRNTPEDERVGETPGWFPDPLWDFPVKLEANRTEPLWINVAVPADARPGSYRGAVVVRAGDRLLAKREFRVMILPATVPRARTLKVTNWFGFDEAASQQFYKVGQFSPGWWTLMANLGAVMAEHRQNVVITPLMELIAPSVEGDHLAYDFGNFDRWVETFKSAGAIGYIEGSHLLDRAGSYDAGLVVHTFQIENGKVAKETLPPDDPRVEPFIAGFLAALNSHLEEKGWKSIYYQHILDEAHGAEPPYYARFAALVHRYLPGVPTMDAVDAAQMPDELQKNCDIWVPQLGRFDAQMDLLQQRIAGGHEVWFYVCLFPNGRYMNRLMDYPLIKARLLEWLDFRYGFTGFLHWGWSYWTPDPVLDTQPVIDANTELLPSGDAYIVYPDRERKSVYSSIRLETMLQGTEDYEMLMALKAKNPAASNRLAKEAVAGLTDYVRDPEKFRAIERELLEALGK